MSAYLDLRKRVWVMPQSAQTRHVEQLLDYEQQILEQAPLLAFRPRLGGSGRWAALAARFGHGTDAPGEELIQLAGLTESPELPASSYLPRQVPRFGFSARLCVKRTPTWVRDYS